MFLDSNQVLWTVCKLFRRSMQYHMDLVQQQGMFGHRYTITSHILYTITQSAVNFAKHELSYPVFLALCSTRVSNELGAGNPEGARIATCAAMFLAVAETTIVTTTLFCCRHVFGYLFSNEEEVIDYVRTMAPLVCLSVILDSLQGVLSGSQLYRFKNFQKN